MKSWPEAAPIVSCVSRTGSSFREPRGDLLMRQADLLRLSLSALYQQKLRTLLTMLGVLFGSFVLVFSLSMGRGVQETIVHEYSRYAGLRQIDVNPNYESPPAAVEEKIEV